MAAEAANEPILEVQPTDVIDDAGKPDPKRDALEVAAREKGWKPESEYDGPPGGFVDADEFLKREPLFDRIKAQSKELKGLKKTIEAMTSQFQTQLKAQVAVKERELRAAKKEAIKDGDIEQVEALDAEIDQLKQTAKEEAPQIPDEVSSWIEANPWFRDDKEMNAFAIAHNRTYIASHPGEIAESLEATAKAVRKAFPEKFEKSKPKTAPSPVEGTPAPKDDGNKGKYSFSRLSEAQKLVYNQMVKTHKVLTHDDYFKGLEEIGELS